MRRRSQNNQRVAPKQEKDELGRRLCRLCKAVVPKGRVSYCSKDCAEQFSVAFFPSHARRRVFQRDGGKCAKCGMDTEMLRRIAIRLKRIAGFTAVREFLRELGFGRGFGAFARGTFWQADHINPVARGGWGSGLDGLRTLCTVCHKEESAKLVAALAEERRLKGTIFEPKAA